MPVGEAHNFNAQATAGAGGGSVGVAGSLALNIINLSVRGQVLASAVVSAGSGDVSLKAASKGVSTVKALPAVDGVSGSSVGIGAAFALSIVNDSTLAGLEDGSGLSGGDDLTINASGGHAMTTEAKTGAASPSVAVAPAIAIAISNVATKANIGTGTGLTLSGKLEAKTEQDASATTSASGDAQGSSAAIGLALGLGIANHNVQARTTRSITAGGAVSFEANSESAVTSTGTASAKGAPDTAPGNVDSQVAGQRSFADSTAGANGGSGS